MHEFAELVRKLGARGIGYAILSMIVEREPIVVVVQDDTDKELISILLDEIKSHFELRRSPTSDIKLANFEVITKEEYFKHWKEFAGKRLIFVVDDRNLICPALDYLERIIEEVILSKARDPIGRLAIRLGDVLSPLEVAKDYYEQFKQGKIDAKKLHSMLESRFPKKDDAYLALEILKTLYR